MYGMDISNYQAGIDFSKGNYDFCIIKATEGQQFIDKSFYKFSAELLSRDKLIGAYHFARPDYHGTKSGMEKEAEHFVEVVTKADLVGRALLVLDWERAPFDNESLIEAWTSKVYSLTGIQPFIYGSRSKLTNWQGFKVVTDSPLWMAAYPNNKNYIVGDNPNLPLPNPSFNWLIWQYSETGKYPGLSGYIDLDYSPMSKEEWQLYADKQQPGYTPSEEIIKEMQWAIDVGLFVGYGDGTYRPKSFLTREQAAILFYKYNEYLKGSEGK